MQQKVTPFLWFDNNLEEAMNFYISVFKDAEITSINRLPEGAPGQSGQVLTGTFRIGNQEFMALNGGPIHNTFNESISFFVSCDNQDEVDLYWEKLLADGGKESMCGWLQDKFGISWQIIPKQLGELMGDPDPEKSGRVMQAMLQMKKIIVADLQKAHDGE